MPSAPETSNSSRFFRPAETWLITALPTAPAAVRNCTTTMSSVVTFRPPRSGVLVAVCALTSTTRSPVTNSARSTQCDPMSANARLGPPLAASTRQFVSEAFNNQSCRYDPCTRCTRPIPPSRTRCRASRTIGWNR